MASTEEKAPKFALHEAARDGKTIVVESLLHANPKLAERKDDDERLPIHWAISYGHLDIAIMLAALKNFDPDVQDASGWTPLMIAVSLKDGDELVELLLRKEADVNSTNFNGQVSPVLSHNHYSKPQRDAKSRTTRLHFISRRPRTT
ncbi:hypothetical protein PVAG01_07202 [Phlyctema vagabunda]|uniref:Uncharacterized protein n=1 Tax=Phlyctema vagabunda TaxID=108571 RepID=A0ABR4PC70_9HELO